MQIRLAGLASSILLLTACGEAPVASTGQPAAARPATVIERAPDCEDLRTTVVVDGKLSEDPEIADAQQGRAQWGLGSDEASVMQVLAATAPPYTFDVPHTAEELEEIIGRNTAGPPVEEVRAWAQELAADRYAGTWLDHAAGGRQTVAFTGDTTELQRAADERFDGALDVVGALHSFRELRALQERISADMRAAHAEHDRPAAGIVTSTGLAEDLNRVSVGVVGGEETAEAISDRYDAETICLELQPVPGPEHAEAARWAPEDPAALGPSTTAIDVTVYEVGCASGESATGRIAEPEIVYGETEVMVTLRIIPPAGDQRCPGNPPTPFTVELAEPLGERTLLDGGQDPPGPPHIDQ